MTPPRLKFKAIIRAERGVSAWLFGAPKPDLHPTYTPLGLQNRRHRDFFEEPRRLMREQIVKVRHELFSRIDLRRCPFSVNA
jgi:hypothetical protein